MKLTIIDYNCGNIHSIVKRFVSLGVEPVVSSDAETILSSDKLLLPGVGHFGNAMQHLQQYNLIGTLNEAVLQKRIPVLGICLGMQLMTKGSEEGNASGLGWIDAQCQKFKINNTQIYKVPNIGWRKVHVTKPSALMEGLEDQEFYFVHAFHCVCTQPNDVLNTSNYEFDFTAAFSHENIYGVQYHPEKSHDAGLKLFSNFLSL